MEFKVVDDLVFRSICPQIMEYEDRYDRFKHLLISHSGLQKTKVRTSDEEVSCIIHSVIRKVLSNPDATLVMYQNVFNKKFSEAFCIDNKEYLKLAGKVWAQLVPEIERIKLRLSEYRHITSDMSFKRTFGIQNRMTICSVVDGVLINHSKKMELFIIGYNSTKLELLSHPSILLALDFMTEGDLQVKKVTFLDLSCRNGRLFFDTRFLYPSRDVVNSRIRTYVDQEMIRQCNIGYCTVCPYNRKCYLGVRK